MYISPQATFRFRDLLPKDKISHRGGRKVFTADGRSALSAGLKILGISRDDTVLIPAYICKIIPSLLTGLGISYRYYPLKQDLSIDTDGLRKLIDSTDSKAVIILHYLGFIDPGFDDVIRLCRDKGLKIIEDCVHALYSKNKGRMVGADGDIGIFSLHKALGTPTGGMLTINFEYEGTIELKEMPFAKKALRTVRSLIYILEKAVGFSVRPYLLSLKQIRRVIRKDKEEKVAKCYAMDRISLKIFKNSEEAGTVRKQRENFNYLLNKVSEFGLVPIYKELPDGVSPFGFPILLEERDKIHCMLYRKGFLINALWDELPEDIYEKEFPVSHYLRQRILVLPVHQDIERRHLDALMKTIREVRI